MDRSDNNQFHGRTIFIDAATCVVWVENRFFLGSGKTIMTKNCFEEWIQDLAYDEINHIHSDNGVFTALSSSLSRETSISEFWGIGAHCQNAHAKHVIQTIIYIGRTLMPHVSLHWSEYGVDDLVLWPFAVKHATCLFNWCLAEKHDSLQLNCSTWLVLMFLIFS